MENTRKREMWCQSSEVPSAELSCNLRIWSSRQSQDKYAKSNGDFWHLSVYTDKYIARIDYSKKHNCEG